MNNKSLIILLVLAVFLVTGCKETHNRAIDIAYQLTATAPDSALSVLNGVDQAKLGKAEMARYALVYTIAQDKSGLDVDNDSLLIIAYTYYNKRVGDSLYAKCMNYMGKFYWLNDSLAKAADCLKKSVLSAKRQGDKHTQCMALEKLSMVSSYTDTQKAIKLEKEALSLYSSLPDAKETNVVYYKEKLGFAYLAADSVEQAEKITADALRLARKTGDSTAIANCCQTMALILKNQQKYSEALKFSLEAYNKVKVKENSFLFNLAIAYLDADSINACIRVLNGFKSEEHKELYIVYDIKAKAAMKEGKFDKAFNYADSSNFHFEQLYTEELSKNKKYYGKFMQSQYNKEEAERRAENLVLVLALSITLFLCIIVILLFYLHQRREKTRLMLQNEENQRINDARLHKVAMKNKEMQLDALKNFIIKKSEIVKKLNGLKPVKDKNFILTNDDWDEIKIYVDSMGDNFTERLKTSYPNLNEDDVKFMMLVSLRLPSKTMATIYNISDKGIRQRLFLYKSKVEIDGESISLRTFIEGF